jgi:hypothetical protein
VNGAAKKGKKSEKTVSPLSPRVMEKLRQLANDTVAMSIESAVQNASQSS